MNLIFNKSNTFCISLYSKPDRWEKMEKRFQKTGLDVTRFKAVSDVKELTVPFANYLSLTQKFCSQSHINLWNYIINCKLSYALILEDDACFDIKWREKLSKLEFNSNLDAIFLNASEPLNKIDTWQLANEQYLTAGYILTYKGAKTLLDIFSNCFYASDWMTSRLQENKNSYTYFPWLIIQEGNESTINSNVIEDHKKVIRCLNAVSYDLSNYII
jgi:GR25 family glycosyltransferase involved in LPS biosynthesis